MPEEHKVPYKDAIKRLPVGDRIHTFRQNTFCLVGCDWSRRAVVKAIKKYGVEETGDEAIKMGHGLVLKDDVGYLFIETREVDT